MAELTGLGAEKPPLGKDSSEKQGQQIQLAEEGAEPRRDEKLPALEQLRRMSPLRTSLDVSAAVCTTFVHQAALRSEHLKDLILIYLCFALLCLWATVHGCSSSRWSLFERDGRVPFKLLLFGSTMLVGSVLTSNIALARLEVPIVQALRLYALPWLALLAYSVKSERMPFVLSACALVLIASLIAMVYCDIRDKTVLHDENGGGLQDWRMGYIVAVVAVAISSNYAILLQTFRAVHKSSVVQSIYGVLPPAAAAFALGSMFFESKSALLELAVREWLLLGATASCAVANGIAISRSESEEHSVAAAAILQTKVLFTVSLGWIFVAKPLGLDTGTFLVLAVLSCLGFHISLLREVGAS